MGPLPAAAPCLLPAGPAAALEMCKLGANPLCNARIDFDAVLGPIRQWGVNFIPSSTNVEQAIFLGANARDTPRLRARRGPRSVADSVY